jgi:predicted transcriptional regulator of viral defense system
VSQLLEIAEVASEQWGLVTAAQAARIGVSAQSMARWAREDVLTRLAHGVYKVAGSPYDPRDDLRAAWLMLDPKRTATERISAPALDAVISHRSAAQLHGLGDLDADVYEFTVEGRRQTRRKDVRIHTRASAIARESWTLVGGLPVTTVIATIVDLAAAQTDGGHLGGIVRDAIATAVVDIDRLSEALRPYAHRYGAALGDGEGAVRRFLTEAGLPRATEQAAELVRDKGLSETLAKMTLSDPEMMQRAIARMTLSDPEMIQRAIAKITNSDVRQMLDKIAAPFMQRDLKQANRALDAARQATK